jgi:hypothetical protein
VKELERHAYDIAADVADEMQRRIADIPSMGVEAVLEAYDEAGRPFGPGGNAAARYYALMLIETATRAALESAAGGNVLDEARCLIGGDPDEGQG